MLQKAVHTQDITHLVSLPSSRCLRLPSRLHVTSTFLFYLSLYTVLQTAVPTHDMTNLVFLPSNRCLRLLSRLPVTTIFPSNFPAIPCYIRQSLHKAWPIHLPFLLFTVRTIFLWSINLAFLHFSHERSHWPPSFSSATSQKFQSISNPISKVPTLQQHAKKCSKYSIAPGSSLIFPPPPPYWLESLPLTISFFFHDNSGFKNMGMEVFTSILRPRMGLLYSS
jgi:hypothetical protein